MRRKISGLLILSTTAILLILLSALSVWAAAPPRAFFQGFEENTNDWSEEVTRVESGTNGITSRTGDFHAEDEGGGFTRWGGYSSNFSPPRGYSTLIDIYLDVDAGNANDTRFDWSSAINNTDGNHRRDFVFNVGFYDDSGGPGSGENRFVISASNNATRSGAFPKNPARDPVAITETGWYAFKHRFYDSGGGVLAVDLSIIDSSGNTIEEWTLSDSSDIIGNTVGGNRYGWVVINEFGFIAIDNSERTGITKEDCKNGGWRDLVDDEGKPFKNQGDCIKFVNTGK